MNDPTKADASNDSSWFTRLNAPLVVAILAAAWAFWDGQRQEREAAKFAIATEQERSQAVLDAEKEQTARAIHEERERRQTQLVLLALQSEGLEDRKEALAFLAQTGLLDEELANNVLSAVNEGLAPKVGAPHISSFIKRKSVRVEIDDGLPPRLAAVCEDSELAGKQLSLIRGRMATTIEASLSRPCRTHEIGEVVYMNESQAKYLLEEGMMNDPIQAEVVYYDIIGLPRSMFYPE